MPSWGSSAVRFGSECHAVLPPLHHARLLCTSGGTVRPVGAYALERTQIIFYHGQDWICERSAL